MSIESPVLGLFCSDSSQQEQCVHVAESLSLPLLDSAPKQLSADHFALVVDADGALSLHFTGRGAPGPVKVDFLSGATAHRRQFGGGKGQLIAKAVGLKGRYRPQVLDLTAGLGQDAFVLATLGCHVTMVERVGLVFQLLQDGLRRAGQSTDAAMQSIVTAMDLVNQDALTYLQGAELNADVIYLDPMFPEREKSAKVKKGMTVFHRIVGDGLDAGAVLQAALEKAKYRVVVKRPRKAQSLAQQYASLALPEAGLIMEGKSSRYDIYPIAKMPD